MQLPGFTPSNQTTVYVFDGVPKIEHEHTGVATTNPVQTGASISDNFYVVPPRVVVEIKMSDTMQSYTTGQFADNPSRSVSAYLTLVKIQQQKTPVSIATRLQSYDNMMIVSIRAEENKDTKFAGKFSVTFENVILAVVEAVSSGMLPGSGDDSTVPQTTGQSQGGQTQTQPVPSTVQSQDNVQNASANDINSAPGSGVPNSGSWTSTGMGPLGTVMGQEAA
jgi:hypothetical protein